MTCDSFFSTITWLGSLYVLLPSTAIFVLLLHKTGRPREMLLLGLTFLATVVTAHASKLLFRRPRPEALALLVPMPTDWSFPSAHAAQATAFFLASTIIAFRLLPPSWAGLCAVVSALIIVGVGWSRVYLQVHYLSDVLAGCALAIMIVAAVVMLLLHFHSLRGE